MPALILLTLFLIFPALGEDNAPSSLVLSLRLSLHDREFHQPVTHLLVDILYILKSVLFVQVVSIWTAFHPAWD
jgi:hypothetical protein